MFMSALNVVTPVSQVSERTNIEIPVLFAFSL
jgi:hypothetical protein